MAKRSKVKVPKSVCTAVAKFIGVKACNKVFNAGFKAGKKAAMHMKKGKKHKGAKYKGGKKKKSKKAKKSRKAPKSRKKAPCPPGCTKV